MRYVVYNNMCQPMLAALPSGQAKTDIPIGPEMVLIKSPHHILDYHVPRYATVQWYIETYRELPSDRMKVTIDDKEMVDLALMNRILGR
jgi:hypothetical protein